MDTIKKSDYPEVFIENEEVSQEDQKVFESIASKTMPTKEQIFFEHMKEKVENEFAPSADVMMVEEDNNDGIYLIRYYYNEFKIGRINCKEAIYSVTFSQAINEDLYTLIGRHTTLLAWLREIDFKGINYNGNRILNRH